MTRESWVGPEDVAGHALQSGFLAGVYGVGKWLNRDVGGGGGGALCLYGGYDYVLSCATGRCRDIVQSKRFWIIDAKTVARMMVSSSEDVDTTTVDSRIYPMSCS